MKLELSSAFRQIFNNGPEAIFFCPGRVNLIGEHIDYNGGHVMPCAISRGTWLAFSRNTDKKLRFRSLDFSETADLNLQTSYTRTGKGWFNYPLGVINELFYLGNELSGMDLLFKGDLPVGAGLSSSASIEMAMAFAAREIFGLNASLTELALLCKKVENEFIGVNSGIMDQFAVAKGEKGKAILLDCDDLKHEYLPFDTGEYVLAIINSRKERKLSESKYNERFAECGRALKLLKKEVEVTHLCELSPEQFEEHRSLINDPVLEKRALHVVSEEVRVIDAAGALKKGELEKFGELMYASHHSLKNDYEVSGKELDTIVEFCGGYEDCIGARMTGAGFGGCAIALVKENKFIEFRKKLASHYHKIIGYEPEIFSSKAEAGVAKMS